MNTHNKSKKKNGLDLKLGNLKFTKKIKALRTIKQIKHLLIMNNHIDRVVILKIFQIKRMRIYFRFLRSNIGTKTMKVNNQKQI